MPFYVFGTADSSCVCVCVIYDGEEQLLCENKETRPGN